MFEGSGCPSAGDLATQSQTTSVQVLSLGQNTGVICTDLRGVDLFLDTIGKIHVGYSLGISTDTAGLQEPVYQYVGGIGVRRERVGRAI